MNTKITIGRDSSCHIRIDNQYHKVSRRHATLSWDGRRLVLEDHSTNGTVVNGRLICQSRIEVKDGDSIYLANSVKLSWSEINRFLSSGRGSVHRDSSSMKKPIPWAAIIPSVVTVAVIIIVAFSLSKYSDNPDSSLTNDDPQQGCRVITPLDYSSWSGGCLNEYAHGTGNIVWVSGETYSGEVVNGHITGKGKYYNSQGELIYEGSFVDGEWVFGKHYNIQGELIYEGNFVGGKRKGFGTSYENNCAVYEGEFENDIPHGYGTLYYDDCSLEIKRKGIFEYGRFIYEEEANNMCERAGREIVDRIFSGGTNIKSTLYVFSIDRDNENKEMIFDLEFNGNWDISNFYKCKVRVRNYGNEQVEFLSLNDKAQEWMQNVSPYLDVIRSIVNILNII
jgi:hypothetical protein